MNNKLRKIINHYGIKKQLKHFQSEVFELNEAIINKGNVGLLESVIDSVTSAFANVLNMEHTDCGREHIKDEIADVMVMLKQFQLYYNISTAEIREVMQKKVVRQLGRIAKEEKNNGK